MDRVLISCRRLWDWEEAWGPKLKEKKIEWDIPKEMDQHLSEDELLSVISKYDGILAGDDEMTGNVLEKAERLRVISKWGAGTDNIDKEAAARRNIKVSNTPGMLGVPVAEMALGYMLMLSRKMHQVDVKVRGGEWYQPRGVNLFGKMVGIIGLGSTGRETARRASAFGMKVQGVDPVSPSDSFLKEVDCKMVELDELLQTSDFVVVHSPLTKDNRGFMNENSFSKMKNGAYFVNLGRGALVKESALMEALSSNSLAGAALDVFETEPLPKGHPLAKFDNVILGSHNASNSLETILKTNDQAIENLLSGLENE